MKWDSQLYDSDHQFVSKYGSKVLELLQPKNNERILDVGCGTGDLTAELADVGCKVTGIDPSVEMIAKAQAKFPKLDFKYGDAKNFDLKEEFDAVFSNAALHWINKKDHPDVLKNIQKHIKPDGRFVAEMGGGENVKTLIEGIKTVLRKNGYKQQANKTVWYFPNLKEYQEMLSKAGYKVNFIKIINRPTPLNTADGLKNWLNMFGEKWFEGIETKHLSSLLEEIEQELKPKLYKNGSWVADYKRLRFSAKISQ